MIANSFGGQQKNKTTVGGLALIPANYPFGEADHNATKHRPPVYSAPINGDGHVKTQGSLAAIKAEILGL
jgi:hypothetical protein